MEKIYKCTLKTIMVMFIVLASVPLGGFISSDWKALAIDDSQDLILDTNDQITRAEWLHNLAVVFNMTVEDEIYPDNYFSDLQDNHEYYYDVLLNVNFGVVDVEAGGEVNPDGLVTRSFASHTLNFCLGYQLEDDTTYTFSDTTDCVYPADAQIAVNRGWVELVDRRFCPEKNITDKEVKAMLDDTKAVLGDSEIDVNYESEFSFSPEVIVVEDGTEVEVEDNSVIIYDSPVEIIKDDIFAIYKSGIPLIYRANNVSVQDNVTTIIATYIDDTNGDYILVANAQGEADLEDVVITPAEGVDVKMNYEEEQVSLFALGKGDGKKRLANISAKGSIKLGSLGHSVSYSVELKKPTIQYAYNIGNRTAQVSFESEVETKATLKTDLLENYKKEVLIFNVGVPGVGGLDVYLKFDLSGSISTVTKNNYKIGASYSPKDNFRTIKNFCGGMFSFQAKISGSAGAIVKLGVTQLPLVKAYVYAEAGGKALVDLKSYSSGTPKSCVEFAAYVYANYGATFKLNAGIFSFETKAEEKVWNSKTSPAKIVKHYEDNKPVTRCTREGSSSYGNYYTKYDSVYWGGWSEGDNSYGFNETGEPIQIFEYSLDDDEKATITSYQGNTTVVDVPETIDGYEVIGIGEKAFAYQHMYSVNIPDSVVQIDAGAFLGCNNLSNVELSKSLKKMGTMAFGNCEKLQSITIPKSLDATYTDYFFEYGYGAFAGSSNLKNVEFEEGITEIPERLFANNQGIEEIVIPDTVTTIEKEAFENTALTRIVIPDSVTSIEEGAFLGCNNLSNVELSKSLKKMGTMAFGNCEKLQSITIPKSLDATYIDYFFEYGYGAFAGSSNLKNVEFEEGITEIPERLFANNQGIEEIVIPDTVTTIEISAFENCNNLKEVTLSKSLEKIDNEVFINTSLQRISLPETLKYIGKGAFCGSKLETVDIPDSVTSMGIEAFKGCTLLKTVNLPDNLEKIYDYMFEGCTSLQKVELPSTLTIIDDHAFMGCTSLGEVVLNDKITKIDSYAFENCDSIVEIDIPNSVTTYGEGVFNDCDNLKNVTLGNGMSALPKKFFEHCDILESIVLPYGTTTIGDQAFNECVKFSTITIPRTTTTIASNAFSYPSRLTINGVAGTYAETYANEIGATFVDKQVSATAVSVDKPSVTLNKGQSIKLVMDVTPANFTDEVTWKSGDTDVATIAFDGTLVAKNTGTATIKLTVGNVSTTCKVTVVQPVTSIYINKSSVTMDALDSYQLNVDVNPDNAANRTVTWSSSASDIASVDQNGLVTAHKKGEATIRVDAKDGSGKYDTCEIIVSNNGIIATSISELESTHNYPIKCNDYWQYTLNGADAISVTFDSKTNIEDGFDYLYIYDGDRNEVGKYTGTELSGKTITVLDDTVRIQIVSDDSGTEWGFKVTDVKITSAHKHSYISKITKVATCTETGIRTFTCDCGDTYNELVPKIDHEIMTLKAVSATCTKTGLTEGKKCLNCETITVAQKTVAKKTHTYKTMTTKATLTKSGKIESKCSVCGYISKTTTIYYPKTIKLSTTSYTYNGKTKSPTVTVKDSKGNNLKKDTDYMIAYASGRKNTGRYSVTVTFKGKYSGKKSLYFNILPSKTSKITPTCGTTSIKASWNKVTGASGYKVELINSKGKILKTAITTKTAYTFDKLSKVTTYKIRVKAYKTISSKKVYSTVSNTITTASAPAKVTLSKVTAGSKSAVLTWKKVSGASGYAIQYSTSSKFKSAKTVTVTKGSTVKNTIKKLTKGKKYYFKLRAYKTVDGKKVYGAWSSVKYVKVK